MLRLPGKLQINLEAGKCFASSTDIGPRQDPVPTFARDTDSDSEGECIGIEARNQNIDGQKAVRAVELKPAQGELMNKNWMRAFAGCFILFAASTSVASAQSSEVLRFGKGRAVPAGDVVAGQNIYNAVCWACHDRDLRGYKGPPLTGSTFYKIWQGRKADALSDLIRNRMPQDDPGWLSEKSAHDLVAYIVTYSNKPESLTSEQSGK